MAGYIVNKQIVLNAPPEAVWDTLTNPEKTKQYFFGCEVHSDWKEGSLISFKRKILLLINFEIKGKKVYIEPGRLLQYTLKNRKGTSYSTVTDELKYADGKTTLSIKDDVGEGWGAEKLYKRSVI